MKDITITREGHIFNVHQGGKNTGHLCFGEMIEQVIALTHIEIQRPRYEMHTDEYWEAQSRYLHAKGEERRMEDGMDSIPEQMGTEAYLP